MTADLESVRRRWAEMAADTTEISVSPYKKDIEVALFGVAWLPHYLVQGGDRLEELPGFAPDFRPRGERPGGRTQ
jgi:hypothetical protein